MLYKHTGLELLEFKSNRIMVANDFHVPQQCDRMVEWLKEEAKSAGITTLAIPGDFNNLDEFSRFLQGKTCKWPEEQKTSECVWRSLAEQFDTVFMVPGNHPFRLNKKTNNVWGIKELVKLTVPSDLRIKLFTTDRNYMVLNSNGVEYLLTHPEQYSKHVGHVAAVIARTWDMNVLAAHSHNGSYIEQWEMGHRVLSLDNFCMCDENKVEYMMMNTTTFPKWKKGFTKIEGEEVTVYTLEKVKREFNNTKTIRGIKNGKEGRIW